MPPMYALSINLPLYSISARLSALFSGSDGFSSVFLRNHIETSPNIYWTRRRSPFEGQNLSEETYVFKSLCRILRHISQVLHTAPEHRYWSEGQARGRNT